MADGELGHTQGEAGGTVSLVLAVLDRDGGVATILLDAQAARPLHAAPDGWRSPLYPVRCLRQADGTRVALAHPYSGNLLIALPLEGQDQTNRCVYTGLREAGDWECFRLEPFASPPDGLRERAAVAARLLSAPAPGRLSASIGQGAADVEVVARLAPHRDFEQLAVAIQTDQSLRDGVFALGKDDPHTVGLRNLMAAYYPAAQPSARAGWFSRRAKPQPQQDLVNDARFASFGAPGEDGTYTSFVQKTNAVARRRRPPTRRICILTTLRDEGPYLLEWIAYHRQLGVEHFFVYSNDNKDGSDKLLDALARNGVITFIENRAATENIQIKAYSHCLAINPAILDYEWCALLDGDEFLTLRPGYFDTIDDYLTWQERNPVDVIALPWAIFWSNGHLRWTDDFSIARFNRQNHGSGLGKSIFRTNKVTFSYPHNPGSQDVSVPLCVRDSMGDALTYPRGRLTGHDLPTSRYEAAWINHYFTRSAEELLWKWSRGRGDTPTISPFSAMPEHFISALMEHHTIEHMHAPDGMSARLPATRREVDALMALPGVREARKQVFTERKLWASRTHDLLKTLSAEDLSPVKRSFIGLIAESELS